MNLIIGGAYQGKLDFAKAAYSYTDDQVFTCTETSTHIDFSKPCINALEEFTLACVRAGQDPLACIKSHRDALDGSTVICQDIFCGVVPLSAEMRAWRQQTGLVCQYLSREADSVSRIFCGLEQKLR